MNTKTTDDDVTAIHPSWTHRGVTIKFNPKFALFYATVGGRKSSAPSLEAMKARIDNTAAMAFDPFDAFIEYEGYAAREFIGGEVVAEITQKGRNGFRDTRRILVRGRIVALDKKERKFIDEKGVAHYSAIPASTAAAKAWLSYWDACRRKAEREEQLQAECNDLQKLIGWRSASDELKKDT